MLGPGSANTGRMGLFSLAARPLCRGFAPLVGKSFAVVFVLLAEGVPEEFVPMPSHQDGRRACGRLLREMRESHLAISIYLPEPASPSRRRMTMATGKASGSVNRLLRPGSVRHMSVTTAAQRRLLTDDDTR
jgi:hypothetical protein